MIAADDSRFRQLAAWAESHIDGRVTWSPVGADAGRRRYFRASAAATASANAAASGSSTQTWIGVDDPPDHENIAAFVAVGSLLAGAGINVPTIHAVDRDAGFMLVSDMGDRRYIDVLDTHNADALFGAAIGALLDWQCASRPGVLADYDRATFAREIRLFHEWFIPYVTDAPLTGSALAEVETAYAFILDGVVAQPSVFVHRDFMPRNLMISDPLPGVIDFQDARYGPASYDVASLFFDAFISWPDARVTRWIRHYWDGAIGRGLPVAARWEDFQRDLALAGAQRHLKILGLFVRIAKQDHKPAYARDLPRFVNYLAPVVASYAELAPLRPYLQAAQDRLGR